MTLLDNMVSLQGVLYLLCVLVGLTDMMAVDVDTDTHVDILHRSTRGGLDLQVRIFQN